MRTMRVAMLLLAAAAPAGREVVLSAQPGGALDAAATRLAAHDLAAARKAGETPVLLVGSARIAGPGAAAALFVQVQSASLCGSAGCETSVFVRRGDGWSRVLDSVSGPIHVLPSVHRGVHDLLVHRKDRWVWNGRAYADTLPVPPI